MLSVSIVLQDNYIVGNFDVDSYFFDSSLYEYAFYLRMEGEKEKLDAKWYSSDMNVVFDVPNVLGVVFVRCFVRDINSKDTRTFDSKKIKLT